MEKDDMSLQVGARRCTRRPAFSGSRAPLCFTWAVLRSTAIFGFTGVIGRMSKGIWSRFRLAGPLVTKSPIWGGRDRATRPGHIAQRMAWLSAWPLTIYFWP